MSVGATLRVIATDPGSAKDINAFCQQTGQELVSAARGRQRTALRLRYTESIMPGIG
ncbi:MAG: sulfurtransferase TusA family protein [Gammaproteobacteria bacterium]